MSKYFFAFSNDIVIILYMSRADDIYNDLRKYAHIKTRTDVVTPAVTPTIAPTVSTDAAQISINDVIKRVRPPLSVMYDAQGVIHDNSTIALKCDKNHIHRYYIKSVMNGARCLTCSHGNNFTTMVRNYFESMLGAPFIFDGVRFINPRLKIAIVCNNFGGVDRIDAGEITTLTIHKTTSVRKLAKAYSLLGRPTPVRAIYKKMPLPFTRELARVQSNSFKISVGSDEQMVDDHESLCFENC